ncbi:MAG: response regulator [Myxococcales bacterium]|nr:response regulator [Myxococcales bacterium]
MSSPPPEGNPESEARESTPPAMYEVDLHETVLFVPTPAPEQEGRLVSVCLAGRDGLTLRALGRVARVVPEREGREGGMEISLLDVRRRESDLDAVMSSLRPPSRRPSALSGPVRVLVVDDDALWRRRTVDLMHAAGYHVHEAKNGVEALSVALNENVHLIVTDVQMPTMDGWQLLRLVRARDELANVPVLFLTTLTSDEERIRGYELGVDDYIDKPFNGHDLAERVTRALSKGRGQPESASGHVLRGDLSRVGLGSLLSFLELERRTGILELRAEGGQGALHLKEGQIVRVDLAPSAGMETDRDRLFAMLDWRAGDFELANASVDESDRLGTPTGQLLLLHAGMKDEQANAE